MSQTWFLASGTGNIDRQSCLLQRNLPSNWGARLIAVDVIAGSRAASIADKVKVNRVEENYRPFLELNSLVKDMGPILGCLFWESVILLSLICHDCKRGSWTKFSSVSSVQLLSHVQFFATPWIAAPQASLFITNSRSLLKLMSIESVMPSSHLILCRN